jgi:carboxylesterase
MTRHPWLDPTPFLFEGSRVGCLLSHGFTGAPAEMRPLGDFLARKGMTVLGLRLAGHGTDVEDLARCGWQDWVNSFDEAYHRLRERCDQIVIGGLSLGGLLTLEMASRRTVDGIILYAPGLISRDWRVHLLPVMKHFMKFDEPKAEERGSDLTDPQAWDRIWCYDRRPLTAAAEVVKGQKLVRRMLPLVECPTLIFQGRGDQSVKIEGAQVIYREIGARQKELVWLNNSGHCMLVDSEREAIWQRSWEFIQQCTGP